MKYNIDNICTLDRENKSTYEIYKQHGTGVMEDPYYTEESFVRQIAVCSEFEAWLICAYKNLELHGPMLKRTSWESPNYRYRKLK